MAKVLQSFKKKILEKTETEFDNETLPVENSPAGLIATEIDSQDTKTIRVLDSLVDAGYGELAERLKELQRTEGVEQLGSYLDRIGMVERQIDELLKLGAPLDTATLKQCVAILSSSYQARAKALILPFGQVSPRSLNSGQRGLSSSVRVAVMATGQAVSPRKR